MQCRALLPALIALTLAPTLRADSAQDVHDLFAQAAHALDDRQAAPFEAMFEKPPRVAALLRGWDTRSTIEFEKNEGGDQRRTVQLNWLLELTERGGAGAVISRRAQVQCDLRKTAAGWRVASFAPADFFAAPRVEDAWTVLAEAAMGLTETVTATGGGPAGGIPQANARKFMQAVDPAMPGYAQLRDNVLALEQGSAIESGVDVVSNQGDDRVRTIAVDWTLNLISRETDVTTVQRRQTVTCRIEKQGNKWRITSIDPLSFFAPRR
jgi:hypothetical protein